MQEQLPRTRSFKFSFVFFVFSVVNDVLIAMRLQQQPVFRLSCRQCHRQAL